MSAVGPRNSKLTPLHFHIFYILVLCSWQADGSRIISQVDESVSFFGDSYQYLPPGRTKLVTSDPTTTKLDFWFKTAQNSGLLVKAVGSSGTFAIRLRNGRLETEFQLKPYKKVEFLSPQSFESLDDLQWHRYSVVRRGTEFSFGIDDSWLTFRTSQALETAAFSSTDLGVHMGGGGSEHFFRGCLADVRFNDVNLLKLIVADSDAVSFRVQRNCTSLFSPMADSYPLTFAEHGSYIGFDVPESDRRLTAIHFEIRTSIKDGSLLYSAIDERQSKYFRVDVKDSSLYLSVSNSEGVWRVHSQLTVSDGSWHRVGFRFTTEASELTVDRESEKLLSDSVPSPELGSFLYFGAMAYVDSVNKAHNVNVGAAFVGCLHNIVFNYEHLTTRKIVVSSGVTLGCTLFGSASCADSASNSDSAQICANIEGKQRFGYVNDFLVPGGNGNRDSSATVVSDRQVQPLLVSNSLFVQEGNSTRLELGTLRVFPEHRMFGLSNKNIVFQIVEKPRHGKLTLLQNGSHDILRQFSFQDVLDGKVNYTHDGSETTEDLIEIELHFVNLSNDAPASLHERYVYTLPIKVTPFNDPPRLHTSLGATLRLAQDSRVKVSQDDIMAFDPDNLPNDVKIKIAPSNRNCGFFEQKHRPGVAISEFSLEDLKNMHISFQHHGSLKCDLTLTAADLVSESASVTLRVSAFQLQLRPYKNTGCHVLPYGEALITNANLSFVTNAPNQTVEIRYQIVKNPKYGYVEIKDRDNHDEWWVKSTFTQMQIDENRVRYRDKRKELNEFTENVDDSFKFQVSALNATTQVAYTFNVSYVDVIVKVYSPNLFIMNNTLKKVLTRDYLFSWILNVDTHPSEIYYRILRAPLYGFLYKVIDESKERYRKLGIHSNFTQHDINAERIFYQLRYAHYSILSDDFLFKVRAPNVESERFRLDITYLPGAGGMTLINRTLNIGEGSLQLIPNSSLHLSTKESTEFIFIVDVPPSHGELIRLLPNGDSIVLKIGSNFTSDDINANRMFYRHDGTETTSDKMSFIARPAKLSTEFSGQRIPFTMTVNILLENDNAPVRLSPEMGSDIGQTVFHVVQNGDRLLNKRDLRYVDADSDFDNRQLRYSLDPRIQQGGFVFVDAPTVRISEFTQGDVESDRVMFRHSGERGTFVINFRVTDGKHYVNGEMHVNVSAPFLRVTKNTGLKVDKGKIVSVTSDNFTVETNLNVKSKEVIFRIKQQPKYGVLMLIPPQMKEARGTDMFNMQDVYDRRLLYVLSGDKMTSASVDWIVITAHARDIETDSKIRVDIVDDDNVGDQLNVVNLKELVVSDRGVAVITQDILSVQHPKYSPAQIVYIVKQTPMYGSLILEQSVITAEAAPNEDITRPNLAANHFTQNDVNSGNVQYLHNLPSPAGASDEVQLTLSINNVMFGDLTVKIRIVHSFIVLEVANITVVNGRTVTLTPDIVQATLSSNRFEHGQFTFVIVKPPEYGYIENTEDAPGQSIASFTAKNLRDGVVQYTQRANSLFSDQFTLVASLVAEETIESPVPQTIYVTVQRPNLKRPELLRNEALDLWNKRSAPITSEYLYVYDSDTDDDDIQFIVMDSRNGNLTFVDDPTKYLHNFSQADINATRVLFVHNGESEHGGFSFIVTDGKHQLDLQWFTVRAPELGVLLKSNNRIVVPPESSSIITSVNLLATMQDSDPANIVFSILDPPKLGQILLRGQPSTSFTQQDIDNDAVTYNHHRAASGWLVRDAFSFRINIVGADSEPLFMDPEEYKFRILITLAAISGEKLNRLVPNRSLRVPNGGSAIINAENINLTHLETLVDSALLLEIVRIPEEGHLRLGDENVTEAGAFFLSPEQLRRGSLVYHHDKFKTMDMLKEDFIIFEIYPENESSKHRRAARLRLPLAIQVVHSSKGLFYVKHAPTEIRVAKNGKHMFSSDELSIESQITLPSAIIYRLTQRPTNGIVTLLEESHKPTVTFTQADVDHKRVYFIHDGSLTREGSVSFKVTDNENAPIAHTIKVILDPVPLSLVNFSNILLYRQGALEVVINNAHLGAECTGAKINIMYNITQSTQNGTLISTQTQKPTTLFSQYDVDRGRIVYMPWNLDAYKDELRFNVQFEDNVITKSMTIRPAPAVEQTREVIIGAGGTFLLNEKMLKVSVELKDKMPYFVVITPPVHGKLIREGEKNTEPALEFTSADIQAGRIRYMNEKKEVHNLFPDSFLYELRADKVQKARGRFHISIQPGVGMMPIFESSATTPASRSQPFDKSTPSVLTRPPLVVPPTLFAPNLTRDHNIVIFVMVPVMFLALLVVVVRRVRIGNERQKRLLKEKAELGEQLMKRSTISQLSRPDVISDSLILASPTATQATEISGLEERTASIRSGKHTGSLRSNGTSTARETTAALSRSISFDKGAKIGQHTSSQSPYHTLHGQEGSTSRLVTFDPGRTEIITSLPLCKVTPLAPKATSTCSSSSGDDFRYAYHYSSSASDPEYRFDRVSLDRSVGYRQHRKVPKSPVRQMKLKENQYWV